MRKRMPFQASLSLEDERVQVPKDGTSHRNPNKILEEDRIVHDWFRFVLSFPPHIVRQYLEAWELGRGARVLDPFAGTATTLVECKRHGVCSFGIEAHPTTHFLGSTKVDWKICGADMVRVGEEIVREAERLLHSERKNWRALSEETEAILLTGSISSLPLHKVLILRECMERKSDRKHLPHLWLALAKVSVEIASNLKFCPEVGVGNKKEDAPVFESWIEVVRIVARDLSLLRELEGVSSTMIRADARQGCGQIAKESIDAVFTSPPYPNEKDYSRSTRLETVVLGFAENKRDLRLLKEDLLRSNTRNAYRADTDDLWVKDVLSVQKIARQIEARRLEMGKTSGFERLYGRVVQLYFGGMARHLSHLRPLLKPRAKLGYILGDQASYLRVKICTGEIIAEIAEPLGYKVLSLDLFRTRFATATRENLKEEVLVLEWQGMP